MKKLNSWFEIDEKEYLMYILQGYEIIAAEMYVCWKLNDKLHREDGPAIIGVSDLESWHINGQRGPSINLLTGTKSWYINNTKYTEEKFNEKIKQLV